MRIQAAALVAVAMAALSACGRTTERDRDTTASAAPAAPAASAASAVPAAVPAVPAVVSAAVPAVVFLGTSLTAGYGLDEDQAYPALIQQRIDSLGLPFRVVNAGVSGETSAGGLRRIDWLLRQPVAVLVLELGANDGLRGQEVEAMRANLQAIIERTREAHPNVAIVVAGMESPPNMGRAYTSAFRAVFPGIARANEATLIPFLLEDVAAVPELNQTDGIHPTAEGQRIVAETVWRYLGPVLERGR
ncbi:MAG: arylesterase [Gemmatimonadota bacterium]|nr:arylesterase [Gemmatimonadota bacterium]MDH5197792.1 arylesterase [Gemmatimonadota bacterium]